MIETYYVCPDCLLPTCQMNPDRSKRYKPTKDELLQRPQMKPVAHEVLACKCGKELNWFTVQEINQCVQVDELKKRVSSGEINRLAIEGKE